MKFFELVGHDVDSGREKVIYISSTSQITLEAFTETRTRVTTNHDDIYVAENRADLQERIEVAFV